MRGTGAGTRPVAPWGVAPHGSFRADVMGGSYRGPRQARRNVVVTARRRHRALLTSWAGVAVLVAGLVLIAVWGV